jgi:pyrimidine deaminase RibD-like protein
VATSVSDLFDYECMDRVIEVMHRSESETGRVSPLVGALAVRNGKVIATAFRGELNAGEHAEYTLLESKLTDEDLSGVTVYTTLEPCTTRNDPKVPCADRLIQRGVARVIVGMLDPNPEIMGRGLTRLRESGIEIGLFPGEMMSRVEEANAEFRKQHRLVPEFEDEVVASIANRKLDAWYLAINQVYAERNSHQPLSYVLAHLVEIVGGLSSLASEKPRPRSSPISMCKRP